MLLNPTKYLGNLLLAGGLIQDYAAECQRQKRQLLLVLDAAFAELCAAAFPGISVLYYPRQEIKDAGPWRKLRLFSAFLAQIRRFRADLAFNIEEDSLTSRLTQLSGARFRLGCSPHRHGFGYERVLDIDYAHRAPTQRHRWHSFLEVFQTLGLKSSQPDYINLHINHNNTDTIKKLHELGVEPDMPLVAVHSGATKDYKQWPESAFIELCKHLIKKGIKPVLLGAGRADQERCARIEQAAAAGGDLKVINLCNRLSLAELAGFFLLCKGVVGNDSGPSHLAAAQRLPGVVIFGPSDAGTWGPLGTQTTVLQRADLCDPRCSRRACFAEYRCLQGISPDAVLTALQAVTGGLG